MTDLLENYSHATFPMEVQWGDSRVRLMAGFPRHGKHGTVVGFSYNVDSEGNEYVSQHLDWDGLGRFAEGLHSSMDLPPPPAIVDDSVQRLLAQMTIIKDRLSAFPDAPDEWRARDEQEIRAIERKIISLRPDLATQP